MRKKIFIFSSARPGNTSNGVGSGGSSREEDDLEQELILMKKLIAASKNTP